MDLQVVTEQYLLCNDVCIRCYCYRLQKEWVQSIPVSSMLLILSRHLKAVYNTVVEVER
jgi:hypothetical protein